MLGRDDDDPLFLQFKEAEASVLEPFLGKSEFANHGQRVVEGQRLMQSASDIMLGWFRVAGARRRRARLLHPPAVGRQGLGARRGDGAGGDDAYAEICGWTLARGHARSGDAVAIASYLGAGDAFDRALADVRRGLRRPERARLRGAPAAAASGRVRVETGL